MAYDGLQWQTMQLPFRAGLFQKADKRARPQPFLDICKDVEFDEAGGLRVRLPFLAMSNQIFGGGTLANCRRLAVVNNELCVFTDTALYSWNAQLSKWVLRATHYAVSVDEEPRFTTSDDQLDPDRAELTGTVMYTWSVDNTTTYVSAMDKTTGSVLMAPTALSGPTRRPRLVALATKILLFFHDTADTLYVQAYDPADPAAGVGVAGTVVLGAGAGNFYYDVVKAGTQDLAVGAIRRVTTTSYTVFKVTPALVVTTSTKARTADGPVAVATIPDGTQIQVIRGNGTNIQGDLLTTSTLADVFTGQAIGTASVSLQQVTVAFSTVQVGGFWVAHAFWSRAEGVTGTAGTLDHGSVNTNNSVGASSSMVIKLGLASRAFAAQGRVWVWGVFARENEVTGLSGAVSVGVRAQLQNTYFLYRDDGLLVGKSLFDVAGGHMPNVGRLPGVAATSLTGLDFAFCGARRRVIELGGTDHGGFEARSPVDVVFSFDSNRSRRSAALGRALYVTDSIPLQYDGTGLFEVGFLIYPYNFFVTNGGGGGLTAGDYVYKSTLAWRNAVGEHERSTTAMGAKITAPGANQNAIQVNALNYTRKTSAPIAPTVEVWRTEVDPIDESPFYLVSGKDPSVLAGGGTDNAYVPNDVAAAVVPATGFFILNDSFADTTLITKEKNPEVGTVLESLAPPGASIIRTTDTRVFLAGVPGDRDAVWYSRLRNEGEVASFHDGNRVLIPRPGGDITAIAIHQGVPVVFRENAVYRLAGEGINNVGQGANFLALEVPGGVGAVNQESVASVATLGTIFKSNKGWQLITLGWTIEYIGDKVTDYDSETVVAVTVHEKQHQVRILSSARMLVWDYAAATEESPLGQWGEWTIAGGLDAVMWQGTHVYLTSTGPRQQQTTYATADYGYDVEFAWIKLADLQGAAACRKLQTFGEVRSAHYVRHRVAYNYKQTGSTPDYVDDKSWLVSPTTVGGPLQVKHGTRRIRCEAIKLRLTAQAASTVDTAGLEELSGLDIEVDLISGSVWDATFSGVAPRTISIFFEHDPDATAATIDLRDNEFGEDENLGAGFVWAYQQGNCGIRVIGNNTTAVVSYLALEAAIGASSLVQVSVPDSTHVALPNIDMEAMDFLLTRGTFQPAIPTGECAKLTGLGLEVGFERGLHNRFPAAQRQ